MGAGDGGYAYQGRQFTPIYNPGEGGAAVRRIKHQPSPLGLRVHPSILLLPLNRASRCVPSRRSSPCLVRRMAGASLPWGHGTRSWLRPQPHAIAPAASHSTSRGDKAPRVYWIPGPPSSSGDAPTSARQSQLLIPCSSWHGGGAVSQGLPPAPAPPEQAGPSSPCSRRNSLVSTLLFASKTGGKWGLLGPPVQHHDQGKPFGWVSR